MKTGNHAQLIMKKMLQKDKEIDTNVYRCKILRHDLEQECIYLVLEDGVLKDISLDAIYECLMDATSEQKVMCTGRVLDRYRSEDGAVVKFEIENGFYKININYVDK